MCLTRLSALRQSPTTVETALSTSHAKASVVGRRLTLEILELISVLFFSSKNPGVNRRKGSETAQLVAPLGFSRVRLRVENGSNWLRPEISRKALEKRQGE